MLLQFKFSVLEIFIFTHSHSPRTHAEPSTYAHILSNLIPPNVERTINTIQPSTYAHILPNLTPPALKEPQTQYLEPKNRSKGKDTTHFEKPYR